MMVAKIERLNEGSETLGQHSAIKSLALTRFHLAVSNYCAATGAGEAPSSKAKANRRQSKRPSASAKANADKLSRASLLAVEKEFSDHEEYESISKQLSFISRLAEDESPAKMGFVRRTDGQIEIDESLITPSTSRPFRMTDVRHHRADRVAKIEFIRLEAAA